MVEYKCFNCGKPVRGELVRKRVRCPHCGSKLLFKPRTVSVKIKAE
jgi:DNA-directed RNA polymerase subunit RPC12/RpoP|tara:strand:+ start:2367 stop:2504 length:138 start_codon:yes stop_codon:yes gene_type:complete